MNLEEYIDGASILVKDTPIHPVPRQIDKIVKDLEILSEKCRHPLKVVLIGASNSGKSTLINALSGEAISPQDVRETTAVIIRVRYANEHRASIHFYEKEDCIGSVEEIFQILESHRNDPVFAESCQEVEISLPLPALRNLELVDTPGLGTLTTENQKRTEDYIQQADVILWTLHAGYINDQAMEDEIGEIFDFGKPLLCIATHIDEVHATSEQIKEAIEDALPGYFDKIFPVNAAGAFCAVSKNDIANMTQTGFQALSDELLSVYDNNSEAVQADSILDSTQSLIVKSRSIHADEIQKWKDRRNAYVRIHEDLSERSKNIEEKLTYDFENWLDTDFLNHEKNQLLGKVNNIGFWSKKDDEEKIKGLWEKSFSEDTIKGAISLHLKEEEEHINSIWNKEISELQKNVQLKYKDLFLDDKNFVFPDASNLTIDSPLEGSVTTIGKTTVASALFGGAASAYAAGLGTYAAHLSMAGALGSFMPPVLVAGVLAGFIKRAIDIKSIQKKWRNNVEDALEDVRRKIRRNIVNGYRGSLQKTNRFFCLAIEQKFLQNAFGLKEIGEVDDRIRAIENHREKLETYMDNAPTYGDVIKSLQSRLNDLIEANDRLAHLADKGKLLSSYNEMKKQMVVMEKAKRHLEQELDKKEKELIIKRQELEEEKKASHISQEKNEQLSRQLERTDRELQKVENDRKKIAENYEKSQKNMSELQNQCNQLQGTLEQMQEKFSKLKAGGIDLDEPDALKKLEESIHDVTSNFIDNEEKSYQEQLISFKNAYPLYDNETINDLATGQLLRKQFLNFKGMHGVDFSPALLPALVMLERVMRGYYVKKGYLHNQAATCPWFKICNDVKEHEYHWRPGFGDELLDLKSVRNQAVHKGNIDYDTYEDSYSRIVTNSDSVIQFIYYIVTTI